MLETIAVVSGRLALPESEDVSETEADRHERGEKGGEQRGVHHHEQDKKHGDGDADTAHEPPKQTAFQTPSAAFGIGRGIGVSEAEFSFHGRGRLGGWINWVQAPLA